MFRGEYLRLTSTDHVFAGLFPILNQRFWMVWGNIIDKSCWLVIIPFWLLHVVTAFCRLVFGCITMFCYDYICNYVSLYNYVTMYIYIYLHKTSWVARAHCCYLITICFGVCSPQTTKFSVQAAHVSLLGCGHPAEASSIAPHEGHKLPRSRCLWQDPVIKKNVVLWSPAWNSDETVPSQLLATSKATIRFKIPCGVLLWSQPKPLIPELHWGNIYSKPWFEHLYKVK